MFILISLAAEVFKKSPNIRLKDMTSCAFSLSGIYTFLIIFNQTTGCSSASNTLFAVNVLFIFLWIVVYRKKKSHPWFALVLLMAELLLSSSISLRAFAGDTKDSDTRIASNEFDQWYYAEKSATDELRSTAPEFYRIRINGEKCFNGASFFNVNTLTSFASFEAVRQQKAFAHLGFGSSYHMLFDISGTAPADMIFGTKYIINLSSSTGSTPNKTILNERALPIA